ncbi:MAG TPA: gephyrin-like molybdotransferase Glp [Acidimicrobiia bacterium]|nr:gephyrin-like molybdotransferase Glp [Acidimicrobiia bacterium]
MRPLTEAQRDVLDAMTPLPPERVPLAEARGLVLAEPVAAPHPVPPFDNSAVDGFAVRAADTAEVPVTLAVVEDVSAGSVPSREVGPGQAIRIMTGAVLPVGADAVVMVEDTESNAGEVRVLAGARPGDHVRPSGGDLGQGAVVFEAGERLFPAHLGVLAAIGVARPLVCRRPVVAVLSTGDELTPVETERLRPGGIRDSNRPMLVGMLADLGAEALDLGIVPDDEDALRTALDDASRRADAVVTSGGVSMGEHDLVKKVLADLGTVDFWRVAMQPAKPFAFGFLGETPLFGLPGNPVSVVVAFEQFVRPALLERMGARRLFRPRSAAVAGESLRTDPEKIVFLRVVVDPGEDAPVVRPAGGQASNVLSALAAADAFAVIPVGVGDVAEGDRVEVEWFGSMERRTRKEAIDG